jgi:hypothetical protein
MFTVRVSLGWDRWYDYLWLEITLLGVMLNSSNAIDF